MQARADGPWSWVPRLWHASPRPIWLNLDATATLWGAAIALGVLLGLGMGSYPVFQALTYQGDPRARVLAVGFALLAGLPAALIGGVIAGSRAGGAGHLHGGVAILLMIVVMALGLVLMGRLEGSDTVPALLVFAFATAAGALGGGIGEQWRRRQTRRRSDRPAVSPG